MLPQFCKIWNSAMLAHMEFAILGSNSALSIAELETVTQLQPSFTVGRLALFEGMQDDLGQLQKRLGGVVKLGYIVGSFHSFKSTEIAEFLASILAADGTGKRTFGISILDSGDAQTFSHAEKLLREIGRLTKESLKVYGASGRFVEPKESELSAATLKFNRVLEKGAEFYLIFTPKEVLIGQTAAYQDIDDWAHRDFHRPARDARRGMLPPKLARMMVNLAGRDIGDRVLLDPFCGSGTVLMEAGMIGYDSVIGSDISNEAVEDTKANLNWLQVGRATSVKLHTTKAGNIPAILTKQLVDVVVTEPFLGKPRRGDESLYDIKQSVAELEELYAESFNGVRKVMKEQGVLVLVTPVHIIENQHIAPNTEKILSQIGFKKDDTLVPLYYEREGQYVGRKIERYIAI